MAVLDSSAIIYLLDGTEKGRVIKEEFGSEISATTTICINEVLTGYTQKEQERAWPFFQNLEILPFDLRASLKSVDLERSLRKKGTMLSKPDLFIASICLVHSLPLITTDKGFKDIEGLNLWLVYSKSHK